MEVNLERLLGTEVCDTGGTVVGRIEEVRAERTADTCLVDSYLIGASGLIARLSAWTLVRPIKRLLRARHVYSVYQIDWQDMDLSDPDRPQLRIAKEEMQRAASP
jgi:sporulation protein YlmC with PRC-barrel domain